MRFIIRDEGGVKLVVVDTLEEVIDYLLKVLKENKMELRVGL